MTQPVFVWCVFFWYALAYRVYIWLIQSGSLFDAAKDRHYFKQVTYGQQCVIVAAFILYFFTLCVLRFSLKPIINIIILFVQTVFCNDATHRAQCTVRLPFGYGSESEMCNECKWNCRLAAALNVPRGIFIGVSLFCLVVFSVSYN